MRIYEGIGICAQSVDVLEIRTLSGLRAIVADQFLNITLYIAPRTYVGSFADSGAVSRVKLKAEAG